MAEKRANPLANPQEQTPEVRAGGYHSMGVPGEEAAARKQMRVTKLIDNNKFIRRSFPVKGGLGAESTSAGRLDNAVGGLSGSPPTHRVVYVLTRWGEETLDTPVFHGGESGEQEAVAVFTTREKAIRYLQVANWEATHEPAALSPIDLGHWIQELKSEGIELVAIDLDRQGHLQGDPQPVLFLAELVDQSGENLYQEAMSLGQP